MSIFDYDLIFLIFEEKKFFLLFLFSKKKHQKSWKLAQNWIYSSECYETEIWFSRDVKASLIHFWWLFSTISMAGWKCHEISKDFHPVIENSSKIIISDSEGRIQSVNIIFRFHNILMVICWQKFIFVTHIQQKLIFEFLLIFFSSKRKMTRLLSELERLIFRIFARFGYRGISPCLGE